MPVKTKAELLSLIENSQLAPAVKEAIIHRVQSAQEVDTELRDWVREKIQAEIEKIFDKAGVVSDENDPEYKKGYQKMMAEITEAEEEFNKTMDQLDQEATTIQKNTLQQIDDAQQQVVQAKIKNLKS